MLNKQITPPWKALLIRQELLLLWILIALAFAWLRSTTILIWDDSPQLSAYLYEVTVATIDGQSKTLGQSLVSAFSAVTNSGYRPLSMVIREFGLRFFSQASLPNALWFLMAGVIIGAMGVSFVLVARYFLLSRTAVYGALVVFLFSTPIITGGWVVFAGIQALVPLLIFAGLLFYWKFLESPISKKRYLILLCLVLFIGPWFREFVGILPVLIIIQEFQRTRRITAISFLSFVFFLHALFPTAITHLLFPSLPLKPVFSIGLLGTQISSSAASQNITLLDKISNLKWDVPFHFLSLFPPLLLGLIVIAYAKEFRSKPVFCFLGLLVLSGATILAVYNQDSSLFLLLCILATVSVTALSSLTRVRSIFALKGHYLGKKDQIFHTRDQIFFLAAWFLLALLPFLKIFSAQIHLAYAVAPAAILIFASLETLLLDLRSVFVKPRWAAVVSLAIFIIAASDHVLNLLGSYRVVTEINNGILLVSQELVDTVPKDSLIISNFLHLEDIRLFSKNYFQPFWSFEAGVPVKNRVVDTPDKLEDLLLDNEGNHAVYFLSAEFNQPPEKVWYHSHKFILSNSVAMEDLGVLHVTRAQYPYLDPFKFLMPRKFISYLGSPDLENDFYRGPEQNGMPFIREVYVAYHLYKVIGTEVDPWKAEPPLSLVKSGYQGFNILQLNERFFAIPQGEGEFDLEKVWKSQYSRAFVSDSQDEITRQIDAAISQ